MTNGTPSKPRCQSVDQQQPTRSSRMMASLCQREFLVREIPYGTARFGKLGNIEAPDCQAWQRIDERKELHSPLLIIAAKEPTMAFGDHQR